MERPWYTDSDVAIADPSSALLTAKSTLWAIKAILKGEVTGTHGINGAPAAGTRWTCYGSCDASTAALDLTDRLGTGAFDATKWTRAAAGTAHTWIVLKSPVALGPYYLIIDWSTSSDHLVTIVFSKAAPTGGTTTARPTATDEWVYTNQQFTDTTTAAAHNVHRCTDANGNFWLVTSRTGTGRYPFGLSFQTMADLRISGDLYPVVSFADYNGNSAGSSSGPFNSTNAQSSFVGAAGKGRNPSGSAAIAITALGYKTTAGGGDPFSASGANTDGKYDGLPIFLDATTAGSLGVRGRLPDVGFGPNNLTHGSTAPATGNVERVMVGNTYLPFDIAPTL